MPVCSGHEGPIRVGDLRARDYVEYAVDTLIEGLRSRLRAVGAAGGRLA